MGDLDDLGALDQELTWCWGLPVVRVRPLVAELRQRRDQANRAPCAWRQDTDGIWQTACGNAHDFAVEGPKANRHVYCPYCGATLLEKS